MVLSSQSMVARRGLIVACVGFICLWVDAAHGASAPVSREEFDKQNRIMRVLIDRFRKVETTVGDMQKNGSTDATAPGKVDLEKIDAQAGAAAPVGASSAAKNAGPHGPSLFAPNFKVYFDLNLIHANSRKDGGAVGNTGDWSFQNFHRFVFMEIAPAPDLMFSFDLAGRNSPNYYELDWNVTPTTQIRAGKIWIPFDDLSPHNIFGGRVNVSNLAFNGTSQLGFFLPNIWADLGLGIKQTFVDKPSLNVDGHLYVVNGFGQLQATDAVATSGGTAYPSFADSSSDVIDNNSEKSIGGRVAAKFAGKFSVGGSFYIGRYTNQSTKPASLSIFGADAQYRLPAWELRAGLITMNVDIPEARPASLATFTRSGWYSELGYKFGEERKWKVMARTGAVTLDSRVAGNSNDLRTIGGTLLWKPGLIEYSLHHSVDTQKAALKSNYQMTILRMVVAL